MPYVYPAEWTQVGTKMWYNSATGGYSEKVPPQIWQPEPYQSVLESAGINPSVQANYQPQAYNNLATQVTNAQADANSKALAEAQIQAAQIKANADQSALNSKISALRPVADRVYQATGGAGGLKPPAQYGVYSPDQLQGQINQMRAKNDMEMANQRRELDQMLSARGFLGNSPLLASLKAQSARAFGGRNAEEESSLRFRAAEANTDYKLRAQVAQQAAASDALKNYTQLFTTLFG